MKKVLFFIALVFATITTVAQSYKVTVQTPKPLVGITYLVYYESPSRLLVQDSAVVVYKNTVVFTKKAKLPPGIYLIVFPEKQQLEFLVDKEQVITIKTDPTDIMNKTVITGSKEDILFRKYQKFVAAKGKELNTAKELFNKSTNRADSAKHEANFLRLNKELNTYRDNIMKQSPKSMLAALFNAMKEPSVPNKTPRTRQDSLDNFNYYKEHYWDGITFMDDRIIRTPFFIPKLERYYRDIMAQLGPQEIIKDVDYKLLLARNSPEMYKLLINWLTDEYINPKYMGQDAIFVHLCEKYHLPGLTKWLNEKQMETITRRYYMLVSALIGEKAANLEMLDINDKPINLYEVQAAHTLVVFWDPNCGHCKEEIPRLDSVYKASWKQHDVKMFAVLSEDAKEEWKKFITENNLGEWIHVYQTKEMAKAEQDAQRPGYRQLYDVTTTPTVYVLDKDKKIVAKKLTWKQMDELLHVKWNKQ